MPLFLAIFCCNFNSRKLNNKKSEVVLIIKLTLQYSLMGLSLFMATSLIWLLLNKIFPKEREKKIKKL